MKYYFYLWAILIVIWTGCKKATPLETDPTKIILGKWETYEMGGDIITNPSAYMEFLPDSVLREFEYGVGYTFKKTYWIDSLLHIKLNWDSDEILWEHKYDFIEDNNKLILEYTNFDAIYNSFTLKRIK